MASIDPTAAAGVVEQHIDASEVLLGRIAASRTCTASVTSSGTTNARSPYFRSTSAIRRDDAR